MIELFSLWNHTGWLTAVRGGYRAEGQFDDAHFDFTHPDRRVCVSEFHAAARRARMRWVWNRLIGRRRQGRPMEGFADVLPSTSAEPGALLDREQEGGSAIRAADLMADALGIRRPSLVGASPQEACEWIEHMAPRLRAAISIPDDVRSRMKAERKWPPILAADVSRMPPDMVRRTLRPSLFDRNDG